MMNRFYPLAITAVIAISALTGCDSKEKLAGELAGTWSAGPVRLSNDNNGYSTVTETYLFEREPAPASGTVTIASMVSLQKSAHADAAPTAPFMMSAAGRATISGSWIATDDDELSLQLDPASLSVQIDPDMVELTMNPMSGHTQASTDSLKASMLDYVKAVVTQELNVHYAAFTKIDDIKFHQNGKTLTFEIGHTDYSLMRQIQ